VQPKEVIVPKGYHHMTLDIRSQIYALKSTGTPLGKIAAMVGYTASSISREIKRNTGERGYRYKQADNRAKERRVKASRTPKKMTQALVSTIEEKLLGEWSPEQIAGRLNEEGIASICPETIYRHIWKNKRSGGTLYTHLRHHGKKYNKRSSGKAGRGCIPNRVDITERPSIVEKKARIGDWEGDTIIGANHKGAIISYVDRCSKFTILKMLENKTADLVTQATIEKLGEAKLPVLTITYDNGKEFSEHSRIASELNASCYFAKPYHSWERGLNEHTNGLVRQYLPKATDFTKVSDQTVQLIAEKLNNRPRKVLNYKTPMEIMRMHQGLKTSLLAQAG
jgi:transposase, IS30 family